LNREEFETEGIKVEIEYQDIRDDIEKATSGEFVSFNKDTLVEEFELFADENELDVEKGKGFLKQQLDL
jgi:hypothetical protein